MNRAHSTKRSARLIFPAGMGLFLACFLAAVGHLPGAEPPKGRILMLGDSITYGGQYVEFFEAGMRIAFPKADFEIISVGLPSETVSGLSEPGHAGGAFPRPDLHERLDRVLQKTKPNIVVACYGMNDGIYYPLGEERFQKFQAGIKKLREKVAAAGARMVHVTPPVFDPLPIKARTLPAGRAEYRQPYEGYNEVLDKYSEWLMAQRQAGWEVVDIHTPINQFLADKRKQTPDFRLAGDGVHPNELGHWLMARPLLVHFGAPAEFGGMDNPAQMIELHPQGPALLKLIQQQQRLLKDAWLTDTGHQRPGMNKGLPLAEAQKKAAELTTQIRALLAGLPKPEIQRDAAGRIAISGGDENTVIRYTLDGSEPTRDSGAYLAPIQFPYAGTIQAAAFAGKSEAHGPVAFAKFAAIGGQARPHSALVPVTQNRDWRTYDWPARHAAVIAAVRARKPEVVLIGDSITHFFGGEPSSRPPAAPEVWDKYLSRRNAVNLGFGWDRTENVLWRLQHGELDGASPKVAIVLIGTNNLDTNSPDEIADGVGAVCRELRARLPQTKILLLAILPRGAKPDGHRAKLGEINTRIAKLDGQYGVTYLDIGARFVNPDGTISKEVMGDYLHPTAKGYAILCEAIEPALAKLMGE